MKFIAHNYQDFAIEHSIDNPAAGLLLGLGLGKTVVTLSVIDILMNDFCEISKVLVIAPKKVVENTWTTEVAKWDHLKHLRLSIVLGTERERKEALKAKADIYVINRENVAWLVGYYQSAFPFDMLVVDELSSFKSAKSIRFKSLKMVRPKIKRVIGLTGTPCSNGLIDLWSELYILDQGERLGKFIKDYKDRFFTYNPYNKKYGNRPDTEEVIYKKIGDICISMKAEDYLDVPKKIDTILKVKLSPKELDRYEIFEKESVLALEDADDISAFNAAGLSTKLRQFANGAVYDEDKNFHEVHMAKLEALEELVEAANGQPVIIFYAFKHDLVRIQKRLKAYKPRMLDKPTDVNDWNAGKIQVLLAHPASTGHGLNLQDGGHIIIWFGLNWSLELYEQANGRLDRQGQKFPVVVNHLVVEGTIDERVVDSLAEKAEGQDALMNAVKAIVKKYKKAA